MSASFQELSLRKELAGRYFGNTFFYYEQTDSTNIRALERVRAGDARDGELHWARSQTQGRGTHGRKWESSSEHGLWFSLILLEPLKVKPLQFLSCLSLQELILQRFGLNSELKWPNDLLAGQSSKYPHFKLSGTLCESAKSPRSEHFSVIGVGVNINQENFYFERLEQRAASLRMLTGQVTELWSFLSALLAKMEGFYQTPESPDILLRQFLEKSSIIGRYLRVTGESESVMVVNVDSFGHLIVRNSQGVERRILSSLELL